MLSCFSLTAKSVVTPILNKPSYPIWQRYIHANLGELSFSIAVGVAVRGVWASAGHSTAHADLALPVWL